MQKILQDNVFDIAIAPMQVVGQFLDMLLKDHCHPNLRSAVDNQLLTYYSQHDGDQYSQPLYCCSTSSLMEFACFVLKVLSGNPQSYQIMRCNAATTSEELNLFLQRVESHHMHYIMLEINKLSFELQEVSDCFTSSLLCIL